ncbi:hypothetical protein HK098_001271 [Nowakowskiella sp. JEL0407]|nr:hypothetical protein HK098_001271 [Nowakowskiella sp. JEL0407]
MWMDDFKQKLTLRDSLETPYLSRILDSHNQLAQKFADVSLKKEELQNNLNFLQLQHSETLKLLDVARETGLVETAQKLVDLENQVRELKDERAEYYKTHGQNAQKLLQLMETLRQRDESVKTLETENKQNSTSLRQLTTQLTDARALIKEKDNVIQIMRDELATTHLELTQREEQLATSENKLKTLEIENAQLVERWMEHKQAEAAKMNEATEFVEFALKSKQALADAAKRASITSQLSNKDLLAELRSKDRALIRAIIPNTVMKKWTSHDGEINCVQVSRDGAILATGGQDKKVILYDAHTGTAKNSLLGSMQAVMSVSFNVTSDMILATSNDNSTRIWNVGTNRLRHTLTGHIGKVYSAKFTDSNKVLQRFVSGGWGGVFICKYKELVFKLLSRTVIISGHLDNNVRLWDTRTANLIKEITGIHSGQVTSIDVSNDDKYVLTTSRDNTLRLLDLRTFETIGIFSHEKFRVGMNWSKSCFSPDGYYVVSGGVDGSVFYWNVNNLDSVGTCESILQGNRGSICGVVWNPASASTVYSADKEKTVVLWGYQ